MQMGILAGALISENKNDKAEKVLDKCLKVMPEENVPYDATLYTVVGAYYELKSFEKANKLAKKLFDIYESDLKIYNAQKPNRRNAYRNEMGQAQEILRRLTGLVQQAGQEQLYNDFMRRLPAVVPAEDMAPQPTQQMP